MMVLQASVERLITYHRIFVDGHNEYDLNSSAPCDKAKEQKSCWFILNILESDIKLNILTAFQIDNIVSVSIIKCETLVV